MALAGLWDIWRGAGKELLSCTILVGPPNEIVEPVHDRMPIILKEKDYKTWLHPEVHKDELQALLQPFSSENMQGWPVGAAVGHTRNEDASLIEPVEEVE